MKDNKFIQTLQEWNGVFARHAMHDFLSFAHESGLSIPQISVLMRLYYRGPTSILVIRQDLYGSRAAASQLVDKLVQMNLVERGEDPQDRRVKRIQLTDLGREWVKNGIAARRKWQTDLAKLISDEDQAAYSEMLAQLIRAAEEIELDRNAHPGGEKHDTD